jgi:hypothetical protein
LNQKKKGGTTSEAVQNKAIDNQADIDLMERNANSFKEPLLLYQKSSSSQNEIF